MLTSLHLHMTTRPDAAIFLNGIKNIPGKACVRRVHNNDAFGTLEISIGEKH